MYIELHSKSLKNYQLDNQAKYRFETQNEITIDKVTFTMVGVDELKPAHYKSLLKANTSISCNVYQDNGYRLMTGSLYIKKHDQESNKTTLEIKPKLLSILEKYKAFYVPVSQEDNPLTVLHSLFNQVDALDYLDLQSFNHAKNLLDSYGVVAGLSINVEENETTLLEVLRDFQKSFMIDVYIRNNKLFFYTFFTGTAASMVLRKKYIYEFSTEQDKSTMYNVYTITAGGTKINSQDVKESIGRQSIKEYGEKKLDINPSFWIVTKTADSESPALSKWVRYCYDTAYEKIKIYQYPQIKYNIGIPYKYLEYFNLGNYITFDDNTLRIVGMERNKDKGEITGVVV